MNTTTIFLSALSANENFTFPEQNLEDVTTMTVNIYNLAETFLPLYFKIDWGDNVVDVFQNNLFKDYRVEDITSEVLFGKFSPLFAKTFSHKYTPSPTSNTKNLTAVMTMVYPNSSNVFTVPIEISSYNYAESVGDIKLKNTNIMDNGDKEHQFITENGGNLFEVRTTVK